MGTKTRTQSRFIDRIIQHLYEMYIPGIKFQYSERVIQGKPVACMVMSYKKGKTLPVVRIDDFLAGAKGVENAAKKIADAVSGRFQIACQLHQEGVIPSWYVLGNRDNILEGIILTAAKPRQAAPYPHLELGELRAVFRCTMDDPGRSFIVKDELIDVYELTAEALCDAAEENILQDFVLEDELSATTSYPLPHESYWLTRKGGTFGSGPMFLPEVIPAVMAISRRNVGSSFFIVPASVHRLMIVPGWSSDARPDVLKERLWANNRNRSLVKASEVMSDDVYLYDIGSRSLRVVP